MSEETTRKGLTRRSFLKTSAATAGVIAATGSLGSLAGCSSIGSQPTQITGDIQTFATSCVGNCHGFACPLDVQAKDGKAVNIKKFTGQPDLESVCHRGYMNLERMYATNRIKYPMRRTGERGSGEFERISWEDAINEICTKWKSYQEQYGDNSIFFSEGSGNLSVAVDYVDRLRNLMGATMLEAFYDANGVQTLVKHIGYGLCICGNEFRTLADAKNIFVWGGNPSESATMAFHYLTEAQDLGAQMVVIDPNYTTTAAKADKHVVIHPCTDALLAIGMMQVVVRDGLQDDKFLKEQSVAPYLVKDSDGMYMRLSDIGKAEAGSEADVPLVYSSKQGVGTPSEITNPVLTGSFKISGHNVTTAYSLLLKRIEEWTPEQISEITEVPWDTIEELAKQFADGPTSVVVGYGMDHYGNGNTGYANFMALLEITGNLAKPGAGVAVIDMSVPMAQGPSTAAYTAPPEAKLSPILYATYAHDAVFNGSVGDYKAQIKSAYFFCHNIIGNQPDRKSWLEIFDALALVVVSDIWMSETARFADIVLPVCYIWETESISAMGNPYLRLMEQVAPPQFESKSDFEITSLLGRGMGLESSFTMSIEEFLAGSLDNDIARTFGVTWEKLKAEKRIYAFPEEIPLHGAGGFLTETGRAQFYLEGVQPIFNAGQEWNQNLERLPYWKPPLEAWYENEKFAKYPLIFTSERSKFKVHTMYTYVPSLLEIDPEPYVKLSSKDADDRGIKTGDTIRVYNDRGYVVIKAVVNPGLRPGMLVIDHGWQGDQFIEGHYSDLSSRAVSAPIPGPAWFDCLCQVEKIG